MTAINEYLLLKTGELPHLQRRVFAFFIRYPGMCEHISHICGWLGEDDVWTVRSALESLADTGLIECVELAGVRRYRLAAKYAPLVAELPAVQRVQTWVWNAAATEQIKA